MQVYETISKSYGKSSTAEGALGATPRLPHHMRAEVQRAATYLTNRRFYAHRGVFYRNREIPLYGHLAAIISFEGGIAKMDSFGVKTRPGVSCARWSSLPVRLGG